MNEHTPGQRFPTPPPGPGSGGGGTGGGEFEELRSTSFSFALAVVELCAVLESCGEYVVSRQLLETGTGIGAAAEEAAAAAERGEVLLALRTGLKSARKTLFWLRLLHRSSLVTGLDVMNHIRQADELARKLAALNQSVAEST